METKSLSSEKPVIKRIRRFAGLLGVVVSGAFLLWLPLGLLPSVPGPVDVFGVEGLRTPASFVVGGLVLAAIGFFEP